MRFLLLTVLAIITISCPAFAQYGSSGYGNPALGSPRHRRSRERTSASWTRSWGSRRRAG